METWLAVLLIVAVVTMVSLIVWFVRRKQHRRERAEIEVPEDVFDAPMARTGSGSGRGGRKQDPDHHEGDRSDGADTGGGDGGGGGGGD